MALFLWAQGAPAAVSLVPARPSHPSVCCCKSCAGDCCCVEAPGPAGQPLAPAVPAGQAGVQDGLLAPILGECPLPAAPGLAPVSFLASPAGQFSEPRVFVRNCAWLI